jgi:hypothetical protein
MTRANAPEMRLDGAHSRAFRCGHEALDWFGGPTNCGARRIMLLA